MSSSISRTSNCPRSRNLDSAENIAAVDERKIYMFHSGNRRQNMSELPVSSRNNPARTPGRKLHACRSWASQGSADLAKIRSARNNNNVHRSVCVCVCVLKQQRLAATPSPHYFCLLPLLENPQPSDAISNSQDNQQITDWSCEWLLVNGRRPEMNDVKA